MAKEQKQDPANAIIQPIQDQGREEEKDLKLESEAPLPLTSTSRVFYMLGNTASGSAFRFTQLLELVRKGTAKHRSSAFPHRPSRPLLTMHSSSSVDESVEDLKCGSLPENSTEINLWERLVKAAMLDIESSSFSWDRLSSMHHTEHSSSNELSEDEMNKALELLSHIFAPRSSSSSGNKESSDSSPCQEKTGMKGSGKPLRSLRLTTKLRNLHKFAKVDAESNKELEQWNEMLKNDVVKLCQDNNFNTGSFQGSDNHSVIDTSELKVGLEHILERIALISEAASTERPSAVTSRLFISGALAARSVYTLQRLGITHILCLCANETGQSDSQFPDLFVYKNFSICDNEDSNISSIFNEACDFIDQIEQTGQRVLVHCFEGKSRSATLVLAYLMLRKNFTLLQAWNTLKRVHRRAQPNDGFAKILLELDQKLHGKVSMEWQQRKPTMKVCPVCGKNAGLSSSSLKVDLQKSHKRLSSRSVDSAMNVEIQKASTALRISRGGSVSPAERQSPRNYE